MGVRADKGRALASYLTGHTGIPLLAWDGMRGRIDAPPPYTITVTTSRKLQNWHDDIRESLPGGLSIAIRYDNGMPSLDQAWVGMQLHTFVPLLTAHYDSIQDRVRTYVEGD